VQVHDVEAPLAQESAHRPRRSQDRHVIRGAVGRDVHHPREGPDVGWRLAPTERRDDLDLVARTSQRVRQVQGMSLDSALLGEVIGDDLADSH
jgi:hypothetical protein